MLKRVLIVCGAIVALLNAGEASAQCTSFVLAVADGRLLGPFTNSGATNLTVPYFQPSAGKSYSVEVLSAGTGLISSFTGGPGVSCPAANDASMTVNAGVEPRLDTRGTRVSFTATSSNFISTRVDSGTFYYSVTDTTLYNPSWSTASPYATQWGLHNTTNATITGTLTLRESFGGSATYTRALTLPAGSTTFVTTFDTFAGGPIPAGRGGSATFTHNGPANSIQGDGYLVGTNGTVVPTIFRAMRDTAR
ncbi:MAG: hypothetical protein AB7O32_17880 [Vicinamibacterales bacterium]